MVERITGSDHEWLDFESITAAIKYGKKYPNSKQTTKFNLQNVLSAYITKTSRISLQQTLFSWNLFWFVAFVSNPSSLKNSVSLKKTLNTAKKKKNTFCNLSGEKEKYNLNFELGGNSNIFRRLFFSKQTRSKNCNSRKFSNVFFSMITRRKNWRAKGANFQS